MTVIELLMADAKAAQARQHKLWNSNTTPESVYVPDRHGYQSAATRGLCEFSISHPTIALAVDCGAMEV
jgi:hypothetical protein